MGLMEDLMVFNGGLMDLMVDLLGLMVDLLCLMVV